MYFKRQVELSTMYRKMEDINYDTAEEAIADVKEGLVIFILHQPRPAGGIERLGCPYVCTSVHLSVVRQVNIFVQGRISRPFNGSNLIFHLNMYLYETSRNIQEPKPHDLYFKVH